MSMTLMAWLGHVEPEMGHSEFRVLFRLCWHLNEGDLLCCPSIEDLAGKTGMSERTVYRAIDKLESDGYIAVHRERWPNGTQKNNRYAILADVSFKMPGGNNVRIKLSKEDSKSRVTLVSGGVDQPGDTGVTGRVTPMSPNEQGRYNKEVIPPSPNGEGTPTENSDLFGEVAAEPEPPLAERVVAAWKQLASEVPAISNIRLVDDARAKKIVARAAAAARQLGITPWEVWQQVLAAIPRSSFLCGRAPPGKGYVKPMTLTIDYVLRPAEFQKILEGAYDDRPGSGPSSYDPSTGRRYGPSEQAGRSVLERRRARRAQSQQPGDIPGSPGNPHAAIPYHPG